MACKVRITAIVLSSIILIAVSAYTVYPYVFPEKKVRLLAASIPDGIKADSIVVFKEKREMILFSNKSEIRKYSVSLGKNPVGDKQQEGDKKHPKVFIK